MRLPGVQYQGTVGSLHLDLCFAVDFDTAGKGQKDLLTCHGGGRSA